MKEIFDFNYRILRQKRNNFRISVNSSGGVTVSVPKRSSLKDITEFISRHEDFIKSSIEKQHRRHPEGLFGNAPDAPFLYHIGKKLPVIFQNTNIASLKNDSFILPEGLTQDEYKKIITELYRTLAKRYISTRAEEISHSVGIPYKKLRFAQSTSRWGSRSSSGTISFSVYLIAASPECIYHVIYHELAHTKEMNHSPKFYSILGSLEPNHRELQEKLHREYGKYLKNFKSNSN